MPSTLGIPENEVAAEWARRAASEPDDHGVEWLAHADKYSRQSKPPASLAHLKRRDSEKVWPEARPWCERRQLNKEYVLRENGKPDPTPTRAEKRTASRDYQLNTRHALRGVYLERTNNRPDDHCRWRDPENGSGAHQTRNHLSKTSGKTNARCGRGPRRRRRGSRIGARATSWRVGAARRP